MTFKLRDLGPRAAFGVMTLLMIRYVCAIVPTLDMLSPPQVLGHFVGVWLPVLLSFLVYVLLFRDASPSKRILYLRACATAVLAPFIAWQLYLFVGFVFLGWQM